MILAQLRHTKCMKTKIQNQIPRRQIAYVSLSGTTQLHLRNPWVITWWSIAFPGFGHLLLSKYIRGFLLIGWELIINSQSHLNLAMVDSFIGRFDLAKHDLDVRWMSVYAPVYLFSIYDSYRTTVDLNHMYVLADRENSVFQSFRLGAMEINYLDKRNPWVAFVWSLLMPGMGQLYIHRILTAFYVLAAWIGTGYLSHLLEAIHFTILGQFQHATVVLKPEWVMFMPSIYGFALYDAYVNVVENNKLFKREQKDFLRMNYQMKKEGTMRVISSFDHSIYLELALTTLEKYGIDRSNILAISLNSRPGKRKLLDTIHRSDGISLLDTGIALGTALTVVCSSIGFILEWGPVVWGVIGALAGFTTGVVIDFLIKPKKSIEKMAGKSTEVVVVVDCREEQVEMVERILWEYLAFGVGIVS